MKCMKRNIHHSLLTNVYPPHNDCVLLVNEMNKHGSTLANDKKLQYDFLLNTIRTRKRYAPWVKPSKSKNLEYVKEYYGYNNDKKLNRFLTYLMMNKLNSSK